MVWVLLLSGTKTSNVVVFRGYLESVIEAEVFLASFGSDRSHMLNQLTRQWNATPPSYECIMPSAKGNLERYMTINNEDIGTKSTGRTCERSPFGSILSLSEIRKRFYHIDG